MQPQPDHSTAEHRWSRGARDLAIDVFSPFDGRLWGVETLWRILFQGVLNRRHP